MRVRELMNPHVRSVHVEDPLSEATRLMWDEDVGCLPVVDEWNRVIGAVTDRDAVMAAWMTGKPLRELRVADCMSRHPYTCTQDDTIAAAAGTMRLHQIHRLPVVDDGELLMGMVTLNDLARATFGAHDGTSPKEMAEEVARTLAGIAEPRARRTSEAVVELAPAAARPTAPAPQRVGTR